jgi:tetratricopeptide (TPR) repeat protein
MTRAFFQPESGEHLMFAYYQSMLVVEYLIEQHGLEALRAILADLAAGVLINDAIERHTKPLDQLEKEFALRTIKFAESYGAGVDWKKPDPQEFNANSLLGAAAYVKSNPANFEARKMLTGLLLDKEQWDQAVESADALIAMLPDYTGERNGYTLKALALRGKNDTAGESAVLETLASLSAEALGAYTRLIEVNFDGGNWAAVLANAQRGLAINPFNQRIHYCNGCAHEAMAKPELAVKSFENALRLDPANPSELRFRLARLLKTDDEKKARRYLLDSLADSPRYREAHGLLLELVEGPKAEIVAPAAPAPAPASQ